MSKKIVGNTKIELTNVRTGKKEVYEKHNMLTGHLSNILSINPFGTVNAFSLLPLVGRVLGGVALFPETKTEDINNSILFDDFTAYAQLNTNGTTDVNRGSFNMIESGPINSGGKDGYRFIWDWGTSQGNGTYNCIALTHPYIDKDRTLFNPTSNYGTNVLFNPSVLVSGVDNNATELFKYAQLYDKETGMFYALTPQPNSGTVTIHKGRRPMGKVLLGESPFDAKLTNGNYGTPPTLTDGITNVIYDYDKKTITLSKSIFSSSYLNSCSLRKEGGVPYVYLFSVSVSVSTNFYLTKINMDTYEFEEKTLTCSGASFKAYTGGYIPKGDRLPFIGDYIYLPKKDATTSYSREEIYKVNINNTSDIITIAVPQEIQNSDAKDCFAGSGSYPGYIMQNDYGYWWIFKRNSATNQLYTIGICNDKMALMKSAPMYANYSIPDNAFNVDNTWLTNTHLENTSVYFWPELMNYYMLSINNLASPVTKTSEQLMKITYTLTEAD